jgi:hypothetical protein
VATLLLALGCTALPLAACANEGEPIPDVAKDEAESTAIPGAPSKAPAADADAGATSSKLEPTSCAIETHTVLRYEGRLIESMTAAGKMYTFEANGTPWSTNGFDLTSVKYYADGPCAGKSEGQCKFDTRTYALFDGDLIEFITAYGKYWAFKNGTATKGGEGKEISSIDRYKQICAFSSDGTCSFDTRAFVVLDGKLTETITAYGRHFNYDRDGKAWSDNGGDLTAVPRYAKGPCKGAAPGACKFDTRTFGVADGKVVEIITAGGNVYRYVVAGADAFEEVQPSGVPVTSVTAWAGGPCK